MTDTPDLRDKVEAALRGQIAALFRHAPGEARLGDEPPGVIADAVVEALPGFTRRLMSTIETLRDRLAETTRERDAARADYSQLAREARDELDTRDREIERLRREVEFEANGADTFAGADARAEQGQIGAPFVAEDFGLDIDYEAGGVYVSLNHNLAARTEAWGDDVNVDYDADGVPTGVEVLRPPRSAHPDSSGGAQ